VNKSVEKTPRKRCQGQGLQRRVATFGSGIKNHTNTQKKNGAFRTQKIPEGNGTKKKGNLE